MDSMVRNKKTIALFLMPALIIYLGIVAVPVFSTIYYSFHKWSLVYNQEPYHRCCKRLTNRFRNQECP